MKAPRGTQDLLPGTVETWQYVEEMLRDISARYNYKEIRTPIFETTDLFTRSVGETTDIVQKRCSRSSRKARTSIRSVRKGRPRLSALSSRTSCSVAPTSRRNCTTWDRCSATSARKRTLPPTAPIRCRGDRQQRPCRRRRGHQPSLHDLQIVRPEKNQSRRQLAR